MKMYVTTVKCNIRIDASRRQLPDFLSDCNCAIVTRRHEYNLCSIAVEPVDPVPDRGVILDSESSMRVHISKISLTCFFHLRRLRKLRPLIDTASAQRIASAFILLRFDYCNAVFAGLLTSTLTPLQRVLNGAACSYTIIASSHTITASCYAITTSCYTITSNSYTITASSYPITASSYTVTASSYTITVS